MTELSASHPPSSDPVRDRSSPWFQIYGVRFRLWPIIAAALVMEGLLRLGREPARWLWHLGPADWADRPWIFVSLAITLQGLVGWMAIAAMRRLLPQADAHLRLPEKGKAMIGTAVVAGIAMALVMFVADYWPQMLSHTAPDHYPVDPVNASGWLFAMAITGLAEEPIFRGLLVGGLSILVPGRLRIGSLDLPLAAYLVAAMFGLAHWQSFTVQPFYMAFAQQVYAFAWGIAYAWLMFRSKSLLAPVIAHGLSDFVEVGLVMIMAVALS